MNLVPRLRTAPETPVTRLTCSETTAAGFAAESTKVAIVAKPGGRGSSLAGSKAPFQNSIGNYFGPFIYVSGFRA